jgi:hypothetical protein
LRLLNRSSLAEIVGYSLHTVGTTHRTVERRDVVLLNKGTSQTSTARETTATAISSRKHLLDIVDARVLFNLELLRYEVENHSRYHAHYAECQNCKK